METFNDVIAGPGPVLVDFYATWCGPCKMMHPVLEKVKAALGNRLRIVKVDVDRHPDTAAAHGIQAVPTLVLVRGGEVLWRQSGYLSRPDLMAALDPFLQQPAP